MGENILDITLAIMAFLAAGGFIIGFIMILWWIIDK